MAAASFTTHGLNSHHGGAKITKSRVKPILKKLHSNTDKKESLDLDRTWEDQTYAASSYTYNVNASANASANLSHDDSLFAPPTLSRDVSFTLPADLNLTTTPTTATASSSALASVTTAATSISHHSHHARSTSGTSHISIATSNSGRNGSFVHPFQQTPRTSTPPLLSYAAATSRTSLDNSINTSSNSNINISTLTPSTITEADDYTSSSFASSSNLRTPTLPQSHSNGYHRRPSLPGSVTGTQRAPSSLSEAPQSLRIATGSSRGTHSSRTAVNQGRSSDAQFPATLATDSPISPGNHTPPLQMNVSTPASATSAMSPLRNSLDMNNFRIRSRSDVDATTRQEQVRKARRKFEEKEKAKDEKYAREQERREARSHHRKGSLTGGRTSSSTLERPSAQSRKSTGHSHYNEKLASPNMPDFDSRVYEEAPVGQAPHSRADDVHFESSKRNRKRGNASAWTAFMLWLRTRLLKLGRR